MNNKKGATPTIDYPYPDTRKGALRGNRGMTPFLFAKDLCACMVSLDTGSTMSIAPYIILASILQGGS